MANEFLTSETFQNHVERIRAATLDQFTAADIARWITEHTFIGGRRYSFVDHEYQQAIAEDTSQEIVVKKPSQVGISELSARLTIANASVMRNFTIAYTLPTAGFASMFMRTRIDPVIESSPYAHDMLHKTTDNSEVKRLGDSYIYLKGSQSTNAPISIPVDMLVHDEVNFSNQEVISQYQSRLTHSPYKRKIKLSTPTIPDYGIDTAFNESNRRFCFTKCDHCNHLFIPDYHKHVVIPGHPGLELRTLTKDKLPKYNWQEAVLLCPSCGKEPSLQIEHRQWVTENPTENHIATGYQISPFDAPNVISVPYLIQASTQYKNYLDFENFGLGQSAEDKDASILRDDLLRLIRSPEEVPRMGVYVMGIDVGLTSHFTVGLKLPQGGIVIAHTEEVDVNMLRVRYKQLSKQFRIRLTVIDALPYTETVLALQKADPNLYAAIYVNREGLELYHIKEQDEEEKAGKQHLRQVSINRDKMLDVVLNDVRTGNVEKITDQNDERWMTQLCDMNRTKVWNRNNELVYTWQKSDSGNDHFHHSLLYMITASHIAGVAQNAIQIPFAVKSVRVSEGSTHTGRK